ncbi:helix-turn-helix domain-containing protein [Lysinibacillus sp. NPDC096418]|uniref:helix-turn-helix domain-containing protein n=1 Tax=Lysinibacillus sp. NPDC096418 TaxID=3364138 RepID=UPI003827566F
MDKGNLDHKLFLFFLEDHITFFTNKVDTDVHQHHYIQVTLSLDKMFTVEIEQEVFQTSGIIIDSNKPHKLQGTNGWQLYVLVNPESSFGETLHHKLEDNGFYSFDYIDMALLSKFKSIESLQQYKQFLQQLMETLQLHKIEAHSPLDPRIQQVINYIGNTQFEEITIKKLSEYIFLSESRLSHLFKAEMGISLTSFLVHEKLKRAFLLIFTGMKMTDAAIEAGFHSSSHFTRSVRDKLGMSPSSIRKDSIYLKV